MKEKDSQLPFFTIAPEDTGDPLSTISWLCSYTSLFDARERVFEVYSLAMASEDWSVDKPLVKANRMYQLKTMIQMVEVVYLLNQLQEKGELIKCIKANQ